MRSARRAGRFLPRAVCLVRGSPCSRPRAATGRRCSNGAGPMVNASTTSRKGLELVTLGRNSVRPRSFQLFISWKTQRCNRLGDGGRLRNVVKTLLEDEAVDIIMPFFVFFQDTRSDESIVESARSEISGQAHRMLRGRREHSADVGRPAPSGHSGVSGRGAMGGGRSASLRNGKHAEKASRVGFAPPRFQRGRLWKN